jgi:phi LC3 family holin
MINWKIRFKNPVFWAQIAVAIVAPILAGLGLQWQDMTTWAAFGQALFNAVCSPVIVVSVIVSVWGIINDPTTKGLSDSVQALTYDVPKTDKTAV